MHQTAPLTLTLIKYYTVFDFHLLVYNNVSLCCCNPLYNKSFLVFLSLQDMIAGMEKLSLKLV